MRLHVGLRGGRRGGAFVEPTRQQGKDGRKNAISRMWAQLLHRATTCGHHHNMGRKLDLGSV